MDAINRWHLRQGQITQARRLVDEAGVLALHLQERAEQAEAGSKVWRVWQKATQRWARRAVTYQCACPRD